MRIITHEQALAALTVVVSREGEDYQYPFPTCDYIVDGAPACIAGKALSILGVNNATLEEMDGEQASEDGEAPAMDTSIEKVHRLLEKSGIRLTDKAVIVLQTAQQVQDIRQPWGNALSAAQAHIEEFSGV